MTEQIDSWTTTGTTTGGKKWYVGTTLEKRARKRVVERIDEGHWIVDGDGKLGDAYPSYGVTRGNGTKKYECSCYSHGKGEIRRKKMCSHVLAVVIHNAENEWVGKKKPLPDTEPKDLNVTISISAVDDEPGDYAARGDGARRGQAARQGGQGGGKAQRRPKGWKKGGNAATEPERIPEGAGINATHLPDDAIDTDDPMLGTPTLPVKFTEYRDNQWDAIVEIMEHFDAGKKVVMLSAPTGSGKTLLGETVRRLMAGQSTYCCTTKSLQDQIQREFEYARTIKGRANYPTEFRRDLTAEDCTGTSANSYECDWCSERTTCPYWLAKEDATYSPLPILNIAYFLSETTSRLTSAFRGRELVIIDEADTLEEQLMSSIEVVIGSQLRKSIGVKTLPKKTVPNDWVRWLEDEVVPKIKYRQAQIRSEMRTLYGESTQKRRQVKRLENLVRKIQPLLVSSDSGARIIEDGWVMTGYEGKGKDPTIRFKPVRVDEHARNALWERGGQFLLMSATLISPTQMADDLGLNRDEWEVVHLDSTFPIENRPIFVNDVTPVTNKTKATAYPKLAKAIDEILVENPGVRVLIHTVSYLLTKYLMEHVDSTRTMTYGSSGERERVLREFLAVDDAVLLAPSFERGIDLPEEDCQIIVIAKVPYPYLGDKQIAARMYGKGGRVWYAVQTIRSIVQMTGRGMRSKDDWCDVVILDTQFKRLYRDNKRLFPNWWRESLVVSMTDPKYRTLIEAARERREGRK